MMFVPRQSCEIRMGDDANKRESGVYNILALIFGWLVFAALLIIYCLHKI